MRLIDYFRILKALVIFVLLFVCMNYVPNKNGKFLEETLAGSTSDAVKTLRRVLYFIMTAPSTLASYSKISPLPLSLCHTIESITNDSSFNLQ